MTSYHGGKQRIGKKIAQVIYEESASISEYEDWTIKGYCEPFSGMLGVYQHIPELFKDYESENKVKLKYKAGDQNKSVIVMWKHSQKGWKPSTKITTEKQFMKMRVDTNPSARKGFVGHFYGYSGQYFQPFKNRSVSTLKNTSIKIDTISKKLKNVVFSNGSYKQYTNLRDYVIYCDPPYQVQSHYYDENHEKIKFDHDDFWEWCRVMSENNIVFVSEYKAPQDFEQIFSIKARTHGVSGQSRTDNLFLI